MNQKFCNYINICIYIKICEIVANNSTFAHQENIIWDYFINTYAVYAAVGVRKQVLIKNRNTDRDISLLKILYELRSCNESDLSSMHLDKHKIQKDIISLKTTTISVEKFVNKRYAHKDSDPFVNPATLNDVYISIELIYRLFGKYYSLLHGKEENCYRLIINTGWESIFKKSWIET